MIKVDRIKWIDYAKGIGIILVVLGHVIGGLHDSSIYTPNFLYKYIFGIIYLFHMPLFFLLSGFFVIKFCEKYNFKTAFLNKLRTLAYPYFIWAIIFMSFETILSKHTNHNYVHTFKDLFYILYQPFSYLWFLYDLFWCFFIFYILKKIFDLKTIFVIALIMYMISPLSQNIVFYSLFNNFIFFTMGAILYSFLQNKNFAGSLINFFNNKCLLAIITIIFLVISSSIIYFGFNNQIIKLVPALLGIVMILNLSIILNNSKRKVFLAFDYLGLLSMQIYLTHILCTSGIRIILIKCFSIYNIPVLIVSCLISGLIFPILFNNTVTILGISKYFFGLSDKFSSKTYKLNNGTTHDIPLVEINNHFI